MNGNDHRRENHLAANSPTANTGTCSGEVLSTASEHESSKYRTIEQIPII